MSVFDYLLTKSKLKIMADETPFWINNNAKRSFIRKCVLSFPLWIKTKDFQFLIDEKKRIEQETGVKHHFDHIIPLTSERVSGLSVPCNIQIIPVRHDMAKGNKYNPDQIGMFDED